MPTNALSLSELRNLPDDELVKRHDEQARTTQVGTDYFLNELNRRYQQRQTDSMVRLTKLVTYFTGIVTFATIVNVVLIAVG